MGEVKSVKVDNWGVFFLQKLQNFFNKTDFCDLTLQFRDNSQLKVHRLVLSACTDFFNVLEQTCELMDDALVMPAELQADVVVPIVNFMYTGTLEFELKMYSKLLRTAKEMNMTVLLKLLEAHKRTMETSRMAPNISNSPKTRARRAPNTAIPQPVAKTVPPAPQPQTVTPIQYPQRRLQLAQVTKTPNRRVMKPGQGPTTLKSNTQTLLKVSAPKMQRGPIRFEDPSAQTDSYESSFDAISYESKPLKEEPEEFMEMHTSPRTNRTSPFEQLRKGFNNNKRPAVATFISPPAKKPNIEDVKEFSEQQRMRKQIAAEFGDDAEFDGILDDEIHHDDDDEDISTVNPSPSSSSGRQQQQQPQQQQPQHASIVIKQSPNEKPTIVVKDSSNSKMDHAKIISEVLRQYPHLVKSNKNIKLKIMPNVGGQSQKIIVKKETIDNMSAEMEQNSEIQQAKQQLQQISQKSNSNTKKMTKMAAASLGIKTEEQSPSAGSTGSPEIKSETGKHPVPGTAKRRIDSKTMHSLIAKGAENTTGPWLCLRCGVNGRPISIPSYRGFRRHLINTHKEVIDPALCEYCGKRSQDNRLLHYHMLVEHKVPSLLYTFPECFQCQKVCPSQKELSSHVAAHSKQQCIYCNKVFNKEMLLYTHMKTFHKKRAREDGVLDFSDEEIDEFDNGGALESNKGSGDKKIKILSDIALPSTLLNLEEIPSSVDGDYINDSGPKFVNADGNEMVLTAEQREEIMSQLDQDHDGGVVMVLNESTFPTDDGEGGGGGGVDVGRELVDNQVKMETSDHADEFEDQNIYSEFASGAEAEFEGTAEETVSGSKKDDEYEAHDQDGSEHEERMDDEDHMEWAENLISAHDADEAIDEETEERENDESKEDKLEEEKVTSSKSSKEKPSEVKPEPKNIDDIHLKLKMLTGDWTDDEIDDEEVEEEDKEHVDEQTSQHEKEKSDEPELSLTGNEDEAEKTATEDDVKEKQQEKEDEDDKDKSAIESEIEDELPAEVSTASAEAEDEVTQSSKSLKDDDEEEDIKIKGELDETPPSIEDSKKSKEIADETESTGSSDKKEDKAEKPTPPLERRSSRRRLSAKEASSAKESTKKDLESVSKSSPPLSKKEAAASATSTTEDDEKEEDDENEEDTETEKVTIKDEKESPKAAKAELSKTPEQVKSLMSEWGDDDDDL